MNIYRNVVHRFPFVKNIHWQLLVFLVMFLNVKLAVKFSAIVFIYLLQPDFHFDFRFRLSRLPLFYVIVIAVAVFNSIIHRQLFQVNYIAVLSTGILFWVMCILAMHQLKMITEKTNAQIIYNTLIVFFLLNTVVSAITYFSIIIETGSFNPFRYQGNYQKYFISTGDYIKGISFDTSTTNAILNAFGMVFFLWKRNWLMVFVCTLTLLFTASNFVNLAVFVLLIFLLFFKSDKDQKSVIVVCCAFLAVFMVKVSPQNNSYAVDVLSKAFHLPKPKTEQQVKKIDIREKPDDSLSTEQRKEKTALLYLDSLNRKIIPVKKDTIARIAGIDPAEEKKISIPQPSIHTPPFQRKDDTNAIRKEMMRFAEEKKK